MKTLKYILILVLSLGMFNSCLVDQTTRYDANDDGPSLAGFTDLRFMVSNIADGTEYDIPVKVKVIGPTSMNLTSDITLTVAPDPEAMLAATDDSPLYTPAVEGVHYRIDNPTVTLKASDNHLGIIHVTMITEGIHTPLPKQPLLILKTVSATGDPDVLKNGKDVEITLNFACYSEFQGLYTVTHTSATGAVFSRVEEIVKIGTEEYLTASVGTWGSSPFTDYGFTFSNACNVLAVPHQYLANFYGNDTWGHKPGEYNPETGVITIYYSIEFATGDVTYTAVYVPVE
jgi:hypothetical protein